MLAYHRGSTNKFRKTKRVELTARLALAFGVLANTLIAAVYHFGVDPEEVWHREFRYPQGFSSFLCKLCTIKNEMENFLQSIYGTGLFLQYGGGRTVLRWIKDVAWKLVLPLELAKPLLDYRVHACENKGHNKHKNRGMKYFIDIPSYYFTDCKSYSAGHQRVSLILNCRGQRFIKSISRSH